jgi:predicted RNA-binding protein associated with RNAse of E/G family
MDDPVAAPPVHVHPPKVEYFDVTGFTNTDPKGFVRPVDEYRVEPWGLYMARPSDHPQFDYLQSWLLPSLGLRATIFHYLPGHVRDQNYYIDIGEFVADVDVWTSVDHYLDIVVRTGRGFDFLDADELVEARADGHLDTATADLAINRSVFAIDGLARFGYDLDAWLASLGMPTSWRPKEDR